MREATDELLAGRTGVVLRDPLPWHEAVQVVQTAEETGYEAVFVPEISGREAFSTLTGFASSTTSIGLGTGVVTMWGRSPATSAMAAATVQDLSGGRFVLGLGAGRAPAIQGSPRPGGGALLKRMEAYIQAVRAALAGGAVPSSDRFGWDRFRLSLPASQPPPPVWLGALGDRMLALAGQEADGVLLNWCTPERVARARQVIDRAASQAGRDPASLTVSVYVRACLGTDEEAALRALREMTAEYAAFPNYQRQMREMGLGEWALQAAQARESGRLHDVPEGLVRALAVLGGRREARRRFADYREAGADLVLCYPVAALEPFSSVLGTVLAAAPSTAVEH
jgi:5,10-methylenetetrahydromethanopterin reductase